MAVKKREIFQVEKRDYHEDKLVSYKDIRTTELNSHTSSHAGLDFHNALLEKMKDHTRNDSTDLSFIFVAFKFSKMYLSCSEANDIAVNLPNEFPNRDWESCSFFTSDLSTETWIRHPDSYEEKAQDESHDLGSDTGDLLKNSKAFEISVNKLFKEEQMYGMLFKVFTCISCELGTSYCSENINRDEGTWLCNQCHKENTIINGTYFIYNKIESSLVSLMKNKYLYQHVQNTNDERLKCFATKEDPIYPEYPEAKIENDKDDERVISFIENEFTHYLSARPVQHFSFKQTETGPCCDFNYYSHKTIDVIIECSEIDLETNKTSFLFSIFFAGYLQSAPQLACSHHSMFIPKHIAASRGTTMLDLDEYLSPLFDDINKLSTQGVDIINPFTNKEEHFKLNVLNISALKSVLSELLECTNELTLCNPNKKYYTEPITNDSILALKSRFLRYIFCLPFFSCTEVEKKLYTVSPRQLNKVAMLLEVPIGWLVDLLTSLAFEIRNTHPFSMGQIEVIFFALNPVLDLVPKLPDCLTFLLNLITKLDKYDLTELSQITVKDLKTMKKELRALRIIYEKLVEKQQIFGFYRDREDLFDLADLIYYYGPPSSLVSNRTLAPAVEYTEKIPLTYNIKKSARLLHSLGKGNVVLWNYMNQYRTLLRMFYCDHNHSLAQQISFFQMSKRAKCKGEFLVFRTDFEPTATETKNCVENYARMKGKSPDEVSDQLKTQDQDQIQEDRDQRNFLNSYIEKHNLSKNECEDLEEKVVKGTVRFKSDGEKFEFMSESFYKAWKPFYKEIERLKLNLRQR